MRLRGEDRRNNVSVFLLHILISFTVLGISFFPVHTVKFKSSNLKNIVGIYGIIGIVIVGLGMYMGGETPYNHISI